MDDNAERPSPISRRGFLCYVGAGAALLPPGLGPLLRPAAALAESPFNTGPGWTPVDYPLPLPSDAGAAAGDAARLARYAVRDELVLPPGFRYEVLARWGERFGAAGHEVPVGYNCDYTALVPVPGQRDDYWLVVNHEYVSGRPWLEGLTEVYGASPVDREGRLAGRPLAGLRVNPGELAGDVRLARAVRQLCTMALDELGVLVLRVRRRPEGGFAVVQDARDHRRIGTLRSWNVAAPPAVSGPAAPLIGQPPGTFGNCSGAVTPWGTVLSCEENFQDQVNEFTTPDGRELAASRRLFQARTDGRHLLPNEFRGLGETLDPPLDGRQFGWVCELDPATGRLTKHTALGRFRHENVALRVETGRPLVAYMGDDRRGGHIWKFVSRRPVRDPSSPDCSSLLEDGTLYVARFAGDFRGEWVPLLPDTPLRRPAVEQTASGHMRVPARPAGGLVSVHAQPEEDQLTVDQWITSLERWAGRPWDALTLGDLVRPGDKLSTGGLLLLDAFAMANCIGGTPTARPEDVEVHPHDASVYIAFTDATSSADGSPDLRVFPDSREENSRQYGALYRLVEEDNDPGALRFGWGRFVSSGEVADGGGGFACADNLAFDPEANVWMVTDISTEQHNLAVDRSGRTAPGSSDFRGVFGNNALFMIPTAGAQAGVPFCFALGPMECELTGPTFTADGQTLILAVQHPGELNGTRRLAGKAPAADERRMRIADRDGRLFDQQRTVPLGSNWPADRPGSVPRPAVVAITGPWSAKRGNPARRGGSLPIPAPGSRINSPTAPPRPARAGPPAGRLRAPG